MTKITSHSLGFFFILIFFFTEKKISRSQYIFLCLFYKWCLSFSLKMAFYYFFKLKSLKLLAIYHFNREKNEREMRKKKENFLMHTSFTRFFSLSVVTFLLLRLLCSPFYRIRKHASKEHEKKWKNEELFPFKWIFIFFFLVNCNLMECQTCSERRRLGM